MKKETKIIALVVVAIWLFVMGFELGTYKERKAHVESAATNPPVITTQPTVAPTTQPTTQPTTAPTTQPTTQLLPSTDVVVPSTDVVAPTTAPTEAPSTAAPTDDVSTLSKAQIIEKMNTYMAQLKAEQNMSATMKESIKVDIKDCSVPSATSTINNIISNLAGDETNSYTFTNGQTADGQTPFSLIPPLDKTFKLVEAGVATAKAEKQGDNVVYTVVLVAENTTAASPVPTYNSEVIGYLDIMGLDLPTVEISSADLKYPGSTVSITVNAAGKVTHLLNEMPMSGYGAATIAKFISGNATFEGGLNETWDFTY